MWSVGVVTYALLSGALPFAAESRGETIRMIAEAQPALDGGPWEGVSEGGKAFVRSLLVADPRRRATARQAQGDAWLSHGGHGGGCPGLRAGTATSVVRSLLDFSSMCTLKKVALEVVAFTTPPEQLDELRAAFVAIDRDGSGVIALEDFREALRRSCPEMSRPEIAPELERIFRRLDFTNKGHVEYNDFVAACLARRRVDEPSLRAAFAIIDTGAQSAQPQRAGPSPPPPAPARRPA